MKHLPPDVERAVEGILRWAEWAEKRLEEKRKQNRGGGGAVVA